MNVALIDIGDISNAIKLPELAKKLNKLQSAFFFDIIPPISNKELGNPDYSYEWYEIQRILDLISIHKSNAEFDFVIGITDVKITVCEEWEDGQEKEYFSLSDKRKNSIISIAPKIYRYNSSRKNMYQYVAYLAFSEILINIVKEHINHGRTKYCLFDESADRTDFAAAIDHSKICNECVEKLESNRVDRNILIATRSVLKWCRKDKISYKIDKIAKDSWSNIFVAILISFVVSYVPFPYNLILFSFIVLFISFRILRKK